MKGLRWRESNDDDGGGVKGGGDIAQKMEGRTLPPPPAVFCGVVERPCNPPTIHEGSVQLLGTKNITFYSLVTAESWLRHCMSAGRRLGSAIPGCSREH